MEEDTAAEAAVCSDSQLAGTDTSLSKCFLVMSLSGLSLTCVCTGRRDTKHRAQDTFAQSVQKHCVLQDLIYYSQIPQGIIILMDYPAFSQLP